MGKRSPSRSRLGSGFCGHWLWGFQNNAGIAALNFVALGDTGVPRMAGWRAVGAQWTLATSETPGRYVPGGLWVWASVGWMAWLASCSTQVR